MQIFMGKNASKNVLQLIEMLHFPISLSLILFMFKIQVYVLWHLMEFNTFYSHIGDDDQNEKIAEVHRKNGSFIIKAL